MFPGNRFNALQSDRVGGNHLAQFFGVRMAQAQAAVLGDHDEIGLLLLDDGVSKTLQLSFGERLRISLSCWA